MTSFAQNLLLDTRMFIRLGGALFAGCALVLFPACRGKKEQNVHWPSRTPHEEIRIQMPPPPPAPEEEPQAPEAATGDAAQDASGTTAEAARPRDEAVAPEGVTDPELPPITFAFDSTELSDGARAMLRRHADYLRGNRRLGVILRGHTDSRGTEEYNLALGSRRAQAVREVLIGYGVEPKRLETVSFGEGLPIAGEDSEASQSRNRRVEFFVYELPAP